MLSLIREKVPDVLRAVTPLIGVVCVLQVALVQAPPGVFLRFVAGSALAAVGMVLLFAGIDMGILPMGRFIGAELPRKGSLGLILGVAFALGFATTVAEPDVLVFAAQAEAASDRALPGALFVAVAAVGVGVFVAIALLRVVLGFSMARLLAVVCAAMIGLSLLSPARFVPLAFDAGAVTTGVLTAPVVLALALGFNSVLAGRSPVSDGFGLLGLASMGAVLAVLLLALALGA